MAKNKNLLLTEATTMRMMGLAGIGSLANPFLKENYGEEDLHEIGMEAAAMGAGALYDAMSDDEEEDTEDMDDVAMSDEEGDEEGDDDVAISDEEGDEEMIAEGMCESCGGMHEGRGCPSGKMNENVTKRLKRLKRLLEQAAAEEEIPPPPAGGAEPPPPMEGGDDAMEDKIKEFVKKLGELVQETLGVQVTVEEQEEEPEGGAEPPPPPEGEAGAGAPPPPAPMAEAINRLVNKVARRVKARLMEAKKKESEKKKLSKKELEDLEGLEAHYGEEMRAGIKGKHSHKSRMAALQAAKSNLKEKQMAVKKKEMMMKKKKAAMAKKK